MSEMLGILSEVVIELNKFFAILFILCSAFGCARRQASIPCIDPMTAPSVVAPSEPACANDVLTSYDSLIVLAPHPDDETLGFAGLTKAYMDQGKQVEVVVTTDGDAYCEACRFWKSSSVQGSTCNASELSNFATPQIDSFGEVRQGESAAAAAILGRAAPTFLGYPDTGLGTAWKNLTENKADEPLHRSDFSQCEDCISCGSGYGGGPATNLTANTLMQSLREKISSKQGNILLATTHWLDGHADHAALGNFVKKLNGELPQPRAIAFAVIHAHTPKNTRHPDCWYPGPQALVCPCDSEECATKDPKWITSLRNYRFHPEWPASLPDDMDYGATKQLCLQETATKLKAVESYKSQLGFLAQKGSHPDAFAGMLDCNGYLISFVRRTEAFFLLTE